MILYLVHLKKNIIKDILYHIFDTHIYFNRRKNYNNIGSSFLESPNKYFLEQLRAFITRFVLFTLFCCTHLLSSVQFPIQNCTAKCCSKITLYELETQKLPYNTKYFATPESLKKTLNSVIFCYSCY